MQLEQQLLQATNNISPDAVRLITGSIESNTKLIMWSFGICVTGFIANVGWLLMLTKQITSQKQLGDSFKEIISSMKVIEKALIGDYENKGLISKHSDLEKDVKEIKLKLGN